MDNNTDTLKKLSTSEKPNNQTKLANTSGPLLPGQIKCNILKGEPVNSIHPIRHINVTFPMKIARAEEELGTTSAIKMTNHSNATSSTDGPDSLNAATYVSVVSVFLVDFFSSFSLFRKIILFVDANFIIRFLPFLFCLFPICGYILYVCVRAFNCMHYQHPQHQRILKRH